MYGKTASDLKKLDKKIDRLAETMKANGVNVGELTDYLYALHAKERNDTIFARQIKSLMENEGLTFEEAEAQANRSGSGLSTAEAAAILDNLSDSKRSALDQATKIIREIQQDTRDTYRKFGLETDEAVDAFEAMFENYVPLAGITIDEQTSDTTPYPTGGAGLQVRGPMTKVAQGRKTRAENIVAQIIAQNSSAKITARKNEALQAMYNLVENNPNAAIWAVDNTAKNESPNSVGVRVNGEQKYIRFVEPQHAETLKNMNIPKNRVVG